MDGWKGIKRMEVVELFKLAIDALRSSLVRTILTMLGVIIGYGGLALSETDLSSELYAALQEIMKAANRSADITRQLLAFARKHTISPKVININKTVTRMTKILQRLIGEDIDMAWLPGENIWPVMIDPGQFDQILTNLCVNARDAISGVGKVTIETGNTEFDEVYCGNHLGFKPGQYVLLSISDNGGGMDAEILYTAS